MQQPTCNLVVYFEHASYLAVDLQDHHSMSIAGCYCRGEVLIVSPEVKELHFHGIPIISRTEIIGVAVTAAVNCAPKPHVSYLSPLIVCSEPTILLDPQWNSTGPNSYL